VPANIEFEFKITLKKFEGDDDGLEDMLLRGLRLVEMDALGGSGSRGYGRVKFKFDDQKWEKRFKEIEPFLMGEDNSEVV
jgi:CRISPR-associated protein Csm3